MLSAAIMATALPASMVVEVVALTIGTTPHFASFTSSDIRLYSLKDAKAPELINTTSLLADGIRAACPADSPSSVFVVHESGTVAVLTWSTDEWEVQKRPVRLNMDIRLQNIVVAPSPGHSEVLVVDRASRFCSLVYLNQPSLTIEEMFIPPGPSAHFGLPQLEEIVSITWIAPAAIGVLYRTGEVSSARSYVLSPFGAGPWEVPNFPGMGLALVNDTSADYSALLTSSTGVNLMSENEYQTVNFDSDPVTAAVRVGSGWLFGRLSGSLVNYSWSSKTMGHPLGVSIPHPSAMNLISPAHIAVMTAAGALFLLHLPSGSLLDLPHHTSAIQGSLMCAQTVVPFGSSDNALLGLHPEPSGVFLIKGSRGLIPRALLSEGAEVGPGTTLFSIEKGLVVSSDEATTVLSTHHADGDFVPMPVPHVSDEMRTIAVDACVHVGPSSFSELVSATVELAVISSDSKQVLTADSSRTLSLIDLSSESPGLVSKFQSDQPISAIAFNHDGNGAVMGTWFSNTFQWLDFPGLSRKSDESSFVIPEEHGHARSIEVIDADHLLVGTITGSLLLLHTPTHSLLHAFSVAATSVSLLKLPGNVSWLALADRATLVHWSPASRTLAAVRVLPPPGASGFIASAAVVISPHLDESPALGYVDAKGVLGFCSIPTLSKQKQWSWKRLKLSRHHSMTQIESSLTILPGTRIAAIAGSSALTLVDTDSMTPTWEMLLNAWMPILAAPVSGKSALFTCQWDGTRASWGQWELSPEKQALVRGPSLGWKPTFPSAAVQVPHGSKPWIVADQDTGFDVYSADGKLLDGSGVSKGTLVSSYCSQLVVLKNKPWIVGVQAFGQLELLEWNEEEKFLRHVATSDFPDQSAIQVHVFEDPEPLFIVSNVNAVLGLVRYDPELGFVQGSSIPRPDTASAFTVGPSQLLPTPESSEWVTGSCMSVARSGAVRIIAPVPPKAYSVLLRAFLAAWKLLCTSPSSSRRWLSLVPHARELPSDPPPSIDADLVHWALEQPDYDLTDDEMFEVRKLLHILV